MGTFQRRAWVATLSAGLALVVGAGPSMADSITFADPALDAVVVVDGSVDFGDFDIDLRSVSVDHRTDDVVVASTFTQTNADSWTSLMVDVDTDLDGVADFGALWSKDLGSAVTGRYNPDGSVAAITCTSLATSETLGVNGRATMTIPRSCLGTPATLAVRVVVMWDGYNTSGSELTFVDIAPGTLGSNPELFSPAVPATRSVTVTSPQPPAQVQRIRPKVVAKLSRATQRFGGSPARLTARVVAPGSPAGTLVVRDGRKVIRRAVVRPGRAVSVALPRRLKVGTHRLTVVFTPADPARYAPAQRTLRLRVGR